jgi:hypothetical protein
MFSSIKNRILNGSKSVGMSVWIRPDDVLEINLIIIGLRNEITILKTGSVSQIEELSKIIPANLPVYLSIDGKGVLHKISDTQINGSIIDEFLPNADKNDFNIQSILLDEKRKIFSIIRNQKLEEIILNISKSGFDIIKVYLGPFSITGILNFSENESKIAIPYYNLILNENSIEAFEKNSNSSPESKIDIGSQSLYSAFIVPFSNALSHFISNQIISIDFEKINKHIENFQFRRLFKLLGLGFILLIFLCLLLNFSIYEHYRQKNNLIISGIGSNHEVFNKIGELKKLILTKEEFLKYNNVLTKPLFAYYADRIAKDIPLGITLNKLSIYPLQKTTLRDGPFQFNFGKIQISGSTNSSNYLNTWINTFKKISWIKAVSIKNYVDPGDDLAKFELEVELN